MIDFKGLQIIAYQFFNKQGVIYKHCPGKREGSSCIFQGIFLLRYLHGRLNRFAVARMT